MRLSSTRKELTNVDSAEITLSVRKRNASGHDHGDFSEHLKQSFADIGFMPVVLTHPLDKQKLTLGG
jgi:hypothetical protein